MGSFVKRKRDEIEVDQPEATQEFEVEDVIIEHPEDTYSHNPKRAKRRWMSLRRTLFQVAGAGHELKWTSLGLTIGKLRWRRKGIKLHEESLSHLNSMLKWSGYKGNLRTESIEVIVGALSMQAVQDNRHYVKIVGQVITLCAVQGLLLRGDREGRLVDDMGEVIGPEFNCGSRKRGNFLEIVTAFGVHGKVIKEKVNDLEMLSMFITLSRIRYCLFLPTLYARKF
ncbi:hypothetical protein LOD99_1568 [Oopsacas minuta]|uniref:Uncharacterized protein n=1 Tax=Oopsacas minuta TaxID=111878 RepID=A0AAV7K4P6_9METZ|nr:hypothetical protein LOD99_1551 [Oopsacas minuta]KAI6656235.1 hypothetical protein LOD99_1568 [Oopsacas minuta]